MFNYIVYRVFEYFNKKENATAMSKTINFLALFQGTLIVPVFMSINLFTKIDPQIFGENTRIKYYIGIPLAAVLIIVNTIFFKRKLKGEQLKVLEDKYHKERYILPTWIIFATPIIFVFILPIIYGVLNGTISFPFLEK